VAGGGGDEEDGGQLDEGGVGASQSGQCLFFLNQKFYSILFFTTPSSNLY